MDAAPLSAVEKQHLLRGLYRFELHCRLFGRGPWESRDDPDQDKRSDDTYNHSFLNMKVGKRRGSLAWLTMGIYLAAPLSTG